MSKRTIVTGSVLILLSLPAALAAYDAIAFRARNRNNGSIISSGQRREYLLYVPRSYDPTKPAPLVISLHGAGCWPVLQRNFSGWNRLADREGFIVVYPAGVVRGARIWRVSRGPGLTQDVRFIADLIDKLASTYNIDRNRIYANGLSNGGGMSFALSCTLRDRIAAVGLVGSAQTLPFQWCPDPRPVPMINFHGTGDPMMPYEGGTTWIASEVFPSASMWTAKWAKRNRCDAKPVESAAASDVMRREYIHCADDADVVFYTIRGGGHTWPGGEQLPEWFAGPTSRSIDATSVMWDFFRAHPLSKRSISDVRH